MFVLMSTNDVNSLQRARATTSVAASIDQCCSVVLDLEKYPDWVQGIAAVSIESVDEAGLPLNVSFEAEGLGRRTAYMLQYDLADAPNVVAWTLVTGDVTKAMEGQYVFSDASKAGSTVTDVVYELTIDLKVPLPGFVKRRAEDKIVDAALSRFKERVETEFGTLSEA